MKLRFNPTFRTVPVTRHSSPITGGRPQGPRFAFKKFQRHDYACGAIAQGFILGHDTGGGKTAALYIMALLKAGFERDPELAKKYGLQPKAACLIVAPGDLHSQIAADARKLLRIQTTTVIDSQEMFLRLSTLNPRNGKRELPAGFYISSFTQLASNGVAPFPEFKYGRSRLTVIGLMQLLHIRERAVAEFYAGHGHYYRREYELLGAAPGITARALETRWKVSRRQYDDDQARRETDEAYAALKHFTGSFESLSGESLDFVRADMVRIRYAEFSAGIGETRIIGDDHKIKCVYSPSLADLSSDTFAHVSIDEAVKIKGETTHVGLGVRQMNPPSRTVLTATPIKNRLPDVFRLAWWATGGRTDAHARWPYADETSARDEFAEEFLISERNLTKEEESESGRRYKKLTPQVCNIHRLWKLLAPVVLRRRKKDFGEDIVKKHRHVVRVPLGTEQAAVYRYHLKAKYRDVNGRKAVGAQLQALRIATANPASHLLERPLGDDTIGQHASRHSYVPKLASAMQLITQILERGEQVVIFSAFHDSLDALSARLNEAGVRHAVADGRMSQKKRAVVAGNFKLGPPKAWDRMPHESPSQYPVLLAGVECMAEGHSFHRCNNVILLCYSWAYDKFEQAINRAHRLNSLWDVNVYPIICEGSIDRKLEGLIQEKGDAAELVLDGTLQMEQSAEVNLAELLQIAAHEFEADGALTTIDEVTLEKQWPQLRLQLGRAMRAWGASADVSAGEPVLTSDQQAQVVDIIAEEIRTAEESIVPMDFTASVREEPEPADNSTDGAFDEMPLWQQRMSG